MAPRHLARLAIGAALPPSLLTLALLAGSCGGGGNPAPSPISVLAPAVGAESGAGTPAGLGLGSNVAVGDNASNATVRGILTFDITGIPTGVTLVSATIRVDQYATTSDPYALGSVTVDHVSVPSFAGATLTANIGTLSTSATVETKSLDVTAQVVADLAASRPRSTFRLLFPTATDSDGTMDVAWFDSNVSGGPQVAWIEVWYLP